MFVEFGVIAVDTGPFIVVVINCFAFFLAVAGFSYMFSSFTSLVHVHKSFEFVTFSGDFVGRDFVIFEAA